MSQVLYSCVECGQDVPEDHALTYSDEFGYLMPICQLCIDVGLQVQRPTHAVWYHSIGCLPDHDEGPGWEFAGTELECEQWLVDHADEYDTSVLYTLYYEPIEWED